MNGSRHNQNCIKRQQLKRVLWGQSAVISFSLGWRASVNENDNNWDGAGRSKETSSILQVICLYLRTDNVCMSSFSEGICWFGMHILLGNLVSVL